MSKKRWPAGAGFSSTKAICNKGFSGNSSILHRIILRVGRQESNPQSLTAHSLNVGGQCKKTLQL
jgi:hypothetical protein